MTITTVEQLLEFLAKFVMKWECNLPLALATERAKWRPDRSYDQWHEVWEALPSAVQFRIASSHRSFSGFAGGFMYAMGSKPLELCIETARALGAVVEIPGAPPA